MAQLEPWWSGLTYLFAKEAGLNGPRGFESLRFRNQHNDMDNILTNSSFAENIYKILTRKDFRNGPLPDGIRKDLVIKNIQEKVNRNLPIKFLQFWGGSKNINLPIQEADLCEEATLNQLARMNAEIKKVYQPGLFFHIVPGDERVQIANKIPKDRTDKYVKSLATLADRYSGLFKVTPVSVLYAKKDFYKCFDNTKKELTEKIKLTVNFEKLVKGARNNLMMSDKNSEEDVNRQCSEAALNYSLVRATEEKVEIFEEFEDYIRSYFVKHIPFYQQIKLNFGDIGKTKPNLERSLFFYTGKKGNITQPWQAIGINDGTNIIFASQTKLDRYKL